MELYGVPGERITTIYSGAPRTVNPVSVSQLPASMVVIGTGEGRKILN